jgi:hypothetical protein
VALWKDERRADLVRYLAEHGLFEDTRVWKLAQALYRDAAAGRRGLKARERASRRA